MEVLVIVSTVASILSAISTIRKNRKDRKGKLLGKTAVSMVAWPFCPVDLIDIVHGFVHWAWGPPRPPHPTPHPIPHPGPGPHPRPHSETAVTGVDEATGEDRTACSFCGNVDRASDLRGILDIGSVVDKINSWMKSCEADGFIEFRVMVPGGALTGDKPPTGEPEAS